MIYPDFLDLLHVFEEHSVQYALIGGYAVGVYAEPRFTKDLDLIIVPSKKNAQAVLAALTEFGAPVSNLSVKELSTPGLLYVFGISPVRVDILNRIEGANIREIVRRARTISLSGVAIRVVTIEDLIALKKLAGRPQDKADIKKLKEYQKQQEADSRKAVPAKKKRTT
ncbi:nucleotidyltransferase [bacterium]|nr:nucleotidyltransferase [bacterium]